MGRSDHSTHLPGTTDNVAPNDAVRVGDDVGRYRIVAPLGRGGMGEVYSAHDPELSRTVALKLLCSHATSSPEATERFIREARAASALNHPNIVTIYDLVRSGGSLAIAMELIEGKAVRTWCDASSRPEQVQSWAIQIAEALAAAHASGIIHRDIKPENLMVRSDGRLKVLDFGLARRIASDRVSKTAELPTGTIRYLSPEQLRGQQATSASDIFSLGIVLYELTTGVHPFERGYALGTGHAIASEAVVDPAHHNATIDREFASLIVRMLAKEPENRPSAAAIVQTLTRRAIDAISEPALAERGTPSNSRGRPWSAAALLGLMAVLLATGNLRHQTSLQSVAVLPLENSDIESEYLSDGIAEEIAVALAQVDGLHVISHRSAAHYKGHNMSPQTIGDELHVDRVVTGSFSRIGDKLFLSMEMLDAHDGTQLWSTRYERSTHDLPAFQHEISAGIAAQLGRRLSIRRVVPKETQNAIAHEYVLRGNFQLNKRTREGMASAVEDARSAISLDPGYARAWLLLASSYGFTPGMYSAQSPSDLYSKTRHAIDMALTLNPALPDAHASLGALKMFQEYDWSGAEFELQRALELNPNDATAHFWHALWLRSQGRKDEERDEISRARALDPLSPIIAANVGWTEYFRGDYDGAISATAAALRLDPGFSSGYATLGYVHLAKKSYAEAIAAFRKAASNAGGVGGEANLGYALAISGDTGAARTILRELEAKSAREFTPAGALAWIYMGLGENDKALALFDRAVDERYHWLRYANVWNVFDGLRGDPRFQRLTERMQLPPISPQEPRH